jgi:hypothetical protein
MALNWVKRYYLFLISLLISSACVGQNVPLGIFYQAVARDNYGKELMNRDIDVIFSIIAGNPLSTPVYQELHHATTSKFGVFSLIIGNGTPTGGLYGELSQVQWSQAYHYLKIEVKFDNDFIDMGTMQFLAVPYALYAQKSLEPGPAGPKGDPGPKGEAGDPASDNQTLSFDQSNLTINGGNSVPLTSLLQNLTITTGPEGNYLGISRGNSVLLATAEADGDPTNEIQDLTISSDKLKITKNPLATEWDLTRYLDNTDNQALLWNPATRRLSISGNAATIDLSELKNDADADPTNEIQNLAFDQSSNTLSISGGNSVALRTPVAFRAGITASLNIADNTPVDLIFDQLSGTYYNDGGYYNSNSGVFQAPFDGIYSFAVSINLPIGSSSVIIKLTGTNYETIIGPTSSSGYFRANLAMKLNKNDIVNVAIVQSNGFQINPYIISGTFSGYRVN